MGRHWLPMRQRTVLCRIATWDFLGDSSFTDNYAVAQETQKAKECNSTKSWNRGKMHPSQHRGPLKLRKIYTLEDADSVEIRARGKEKKQGS